MLLIVVISISFVLRLYPVLHLHTVPLYGDMVHYNHLARSIIDNGVYSYWGTQPDAFVTPGYPVFLVICYQIAKYLHISSQNGQILFTVYVQMVLSSLTVGFLYLIAEKIFNKWWAFFISLCFAFYLPSISSVELLLTETLYVFFLLGFVYTFILAMEKQQWQFWLLSGIVLGLTTLVRPTTFPLVLSVLIWGLFKKKGLLKSIRLESLYAFGFVIVMLPWWIRNMVTLHRLLLTDDDSGNPLLYGTDPNFEHDNLIVGVKNQQALAIQRIKYGIVHHPWSTFKWYTVGKLQYLFSKPWYMGKPNALSDIWNYLHPLVVILGMIGILLGTVVPKYRFVSIIAIYLTIIQLPFIPINRYAYPVMPFLFIGVLYLIFIGRKLAPGIARRLQGNATH